MRMLRVEYNQLTLKGQLRHNGFAGDRTVRVNDINQGDIGGLRDRNTHCVTSQHAVLNREPLFNTYKSQARA
jgi:hypothetical protein